MFLRKRLINQAPHHQDVSLLCFISLIRLNLKIPSPPCVRLHNLKLMGKGGNSRNSKLTFRITTPAQQTSTTQSTSQISVFSINIQRLNTAKQTIKPTTVLPKNRDINIFVDSGITDQGHKKIKYMNMHLLGQYNTISPYTAQRA